ncbi:phospholipid carrier-dependent glycosyltransferase [Actomonas aquatica]|uniref:Phospholipid carrier-dependent glycosyltransferase n=1 Tax=Actomonas aquatica TaxID=2866162 RepID=A0ABZ1CFX6_9BACT|nr:phospholipid carrier-dependent glycosyltransferase [Opitutus sp. WL0086]WRQ89190.1 phospholipid carrier-dependent glycosyltransferase [Opitutus sp. WL0086]
MTARWQRLLGQLGPGLAWLVLVCGGLTLVPDYGLYIDEYTNHFFGVTWYDYARDVIVDGQPIAPLNGATDHDVVHGPIFEMALAWLGRSVLHLEGLPAVIHLRHAAVWLSFCAAVLMVYGLARQLGLGRGWALVAGGFTLCQPRIFSHAFYDSVDISFLAFYAAGLLSLVWYARRPHLGRLVLHAVACACAISVRSIGAVLPILTGGVILYHLITATAATSTVSGKARHPRWRLIGHGLLYPLLVFGVTVLSWPFLWNHPLDRLAEVVQLTPRVGWAGKVLYGGTEIITTDLPWHYVPVWILITTPVAISLLTLVGGLDLLVATLRHPWRTCRERLPELCVAGAFAGPLAAVILLRAEVYDGWRHLFFIYPAMCLLAALGLHRASQWTRALLPATWHRPAFATGALLIALNLGAMVLFAVRHHPYQNLYFNRLAGPDLPTAKSRFELDFWGLSYLEALRHLVATQPDGPLRIYHGQNAMLAINRTMLADADHHRIQQVEYDAAEWVFSNYRQRRHGYPDLAEYYSLIIDDAKVITIYRKDPAQP